MRFNKKFKKASLELSVNAIVILVLAIIMLGLGLGFTKGMFSKLQGKLEIPPPNIPATAQEPIVLPSDEVDISRGAGIINVNIFNPCSSANQLVTLSFVTSCLIPNADGTAYTTEPYTDITSTEQKVPTDSFRTFKVIVGDSTPIAGGANCLVTITASSNAGVCPIGSKQITLKSK